MELAVASDASSGEKGGRVWVLFPLLSSFSVSGLFSMVIIMFEMWDDGEHDFWNGKPLAKRVAPPSPRWSPLCKAMRCAIVWTLLMRMNMLSVHSRRISRFKVALEHRASVHYSIATGTSYSALRSCLGGSLREWTLILVVTNYPGRVFRGRVSLRVLAVRHAGNVRTEIHRAAASHSRVVMDEHSWADGIGERRYLMIIIIIESSGER